MDGCVAVLYCTSRSDDLTLSLWTTTDYAKDFMGARRAGWHAVLLNRYGEEELAEEWKRRGAIVFEDLMDIILWLGQTGAQLG